MLGIGWLIAASLQSLPQSQTTFFSVCLLLRALRVGFRGHPNPEWLRLNLVISTKFLLVNEVPFMDSRRYDYDGDKPGTVYPLVPQNSHPSHVQHILLPIVPHGLHPLQH